MPRGRKSEQRSDQNSDRAVPEPKPTRGAAAPVKVPVKLAVKLGDAEVAQALRAVPDWSEVSEAIQRTYRFGDFRQSMTFVAKVADAAESAQHHPDILVRFNKVTLTLSTHDAGGITAKDFDLAARCDSFAGA